MSHLPSANTGLVWWYRLLIGWQHPLKKWNNGSYPAKLRSTHLRSRGGVHLLNQNVTDRQHLLISIFCHQLYAVSDRSVDTYAQTEDWWELIRLSNILATKVRLLGALFQASNTYWQSGFREGKEALQEPFIWQLSGVSIKTLRSISEQNQLTKKTQEIVAKEICGGIGCQK